MATITVFIPELARSVTVRGPKPHAVTVDAAPDPASVTVRHPIILDSLQWAIVRPEMSRAELEALSDDTLQRLLNAAARANLAFAREAMRESKGRSS